MSDDPRDIRPELEQLAKAARAEMARLGREFRDTMKTLTSSIAQRPDELHRRLDDAADRFQREMASLADGLRKAAEARFIRPPFPPQRRPYVERFPPRPRRPRGGKRPSAGGVLVTPDNPRGLSGGAAAPLEFDRD